MPYAGGLAFELPFGTIYSPNITADKDTGIGNWSDAQFLNALHQGIDDEGERLYPAMPYASYTYMTDADALAIKAYLFSLKPVHQENPENTLSFPFNQRWLMGSGVRSSTPTGASNPTRRAARMESRRLSVRSACALRRMPHAAQSRFRARQPEEICRRADRRMACLQHLRRHSDRRRRVERRRT